MMNSLLPALIVFGGLLAIALFGLIMSDAAAARLNGSGQSPDDTTGWREASMRTPDSEVME